MEGYDLQFGKQRFLAGQEKILFHHESGSLLVADCHFGKTTHFRKNHIPIPAEAAVRDFQQLHFCLEKYQPQTCIFLGDLFHSSSNQEWKWLTSLLKSHNKIHFQLVEGNHDILPLDHYVQSGISVFEAIELTSEILLTHEPFFDETKYNICGHIHPGFTIYGKARQQISMPCFFVTERQLIMPAFGQLTGFVRMNNRAKGGMALCLAEGKFYPVENNKG